MEEGSNVRVWGTETSGAASLAKILRAQERIIDENTFQRQNETEVGGVNILCLSVWRSRLDEIKDTYRSLQEDFDITCVLITNVHFQKKEKGDSFSTTDLVDMVVDCCRVSRRRILLLDHIELSYEQTGIISDLIKEALSLQEVQSSFKQSGQHTDYDHLVKIILLGDVGVGKTALLLRFTDDMFTDNFATIGLDFKIRTVTLHEKTIKLQLWDTGDQERFRTIDSTYYRGCRGVLIVYDITDSKSFHSLKDWFKEVDRYTNNVPKVVVGNKSDLADKRAISHNEGKVWADEHGACFVETSAKSGNNAEDAFFLLCSSIYAKFLESKEEESAGRTIKLGIELHTSIKKKQKAFCFV